MHSFIIKIKSLKRPHHSWPTGAGARRGRLPAGVFRRWLCLLLLFPPCLPAIDVREVQPGVWLHQGRHLPVDHHQGDDIANIGFVVGQRCVAVIDSGGSVAMGRALLAEVRRVSKQPICYVINTHIHFDHLLGNAAFADGQTRFVGHANLAQAVEHNRQFFLDQFPQWLNGLPEEGAIVAPDLLVTEEMRLDLGARTLWLVAFATAHTDTDLVIIDEQTATLWAGDLIFRQRLPALTGALRGWLQAMDRLRALQPQLALVIPGHGPVAHSMEEALAAQQRYLDALLGDVRQAIQSGQFVNELSERTDNPQQWLLFAEQHPANVSRAWRELEWE